jgi:hypothetical protein
VTGLRRWEAASVNLAAPSAPKMRAEAIRSLTLVICEETWRRDQEVEDGGRLRKGKR